MREKERKGRGASVRQRTRLSLATPMIHRIYSQTVCQTIGQEFGETRTSVIGAQAQKEIRASERYAHYCARGGGWTCEHGLMAGPLGKPRVHGKRGVRIVSLANEMMEVWTQEKPSNVTAQPPDASRYIIFGAGSCYHRR